ncbi:MAG: SH3 domain-containing protein [Chloroflexota bacterium]
MTRGNSAAWQRQRFPGSFARLFAVVCMAMLLPGTAHARSVGASVWGVHVCTGAHYDAARLVCRQSAKALSTGAFAGAQLSITGRSGAKFTSGTLRLTLLTRTHAGAVPLGKLILSVGPADHTRSLALVDAFIAFGVEPSAGRTYVVEATERDGSSDILLGSAAFTLRPSGIAPDQVPPAGNPRLVVIKGYGAALRVNPSSDAPIQVIVPCGAQLTILSQSQGWYRVFRSSPAAIGWVGGLRVAPLAGAPAFSCAGAVTYQVGERVRTHVPTGCLSLRSSPARQASYAHCVANGHIYAITNGPIEVAGEDWFGVFSPSTGGGWVLARYLSRA